MKFQHIHGIIFLIAALSFSACSHSDYSKMYKNKKTYAKALTYPEFKKADYQRGMLSQYRANYDVQHYEIAIDINPQKKHIQGHVAMEFKVVDELNTMQIDLFKNMKIDSIVYANAKLTFQRNGHSALIHTPQLHKNDTHTLLIYYNGKPTIAKRPPWEGGFVWKKDENNNDWIGVTCEQVGASLWWPCKDHLSDEPDKGVRLHVTVPKELQVIANGVLEKQEQLPNNKTTYTWNTSYPINNYNVTFYAGVYDEFSTTYHGIKDTFELQYYTLPRYKEKATETFEQVPEIISFFEETFGEYPWTKEGYKLVVSPYEGMEHQTAIAYGTGFKPHDLGFDYIILHETAHEWWGNAVSVDDVADIFIHEGFATYAEALYVEHKYGKEAMQEYLEKYMRYIHNFNPIVGPRNVNYWNYKDTDPYMKGAWTLHGLRFLINNDSLFFDILQSFYHTYKYKIVSVQDFIDAVHEKTETDYNWYFKQYLYMSAVPILESRIYKESEAYVVEMRWSNVHDNFIMPLEFNVDGNKFRVEVTPEFKRYVFHNIEDFTHTAYTSYFIYKNFE